MRQMKVNLAFACNEAFFPGLLVTLSSVLLNGTEDAEFRIFVLDGGIRDESWQRLAATLERFSVPTELHKVPIDLGSFAGCKALNENHVAYARLLLPSLIAEPRVVYLDSDLLFLKNVQQLFALPLDGCCAAAGPDSGVKFLHNDCPHPDLLDTKPNAPYFNSGVFVWDLAAWRKQGLDEQVRAFIEQYGASCRLYDQTILNWLLVNKVKLLDPSWNVFSGSTPASFVNLASNIHFVIMKPWQCFQPGINHSLWHSLAELIGYDLAKVKSGSRYRLFKLGKLLWQIRLLALFESALRPLLSSDQRQFIAQLQVTFDHQDQIEELRARWSQRLSPSPAGRLSSATGRSLMRRVSARLAGWLDMIDFFPRPIQAVSYENLPHVQKHAVRKFSSSDMPKSIHEASEWIRWNKGLPGQLRSQYLRSCHTVFLGPGFADEFGNVFSEQRCLVIGASLPYREALQDYYLPKRLFPRIYRGRRVGVLTHGMQDNYYHWLMDVLPRVHMLQSQDSPPTQLYVRTKKNFQKETIRLLGFDDHQIINAAGHELVFAEELTAPFHEIKPPMEHPTWVCDFLRTSFLPLADQEKLNHTPKRIYISRRANPRRQVVNEHEVMGLLEPLGFRSVTLEELPFLDQVRLFQRAEAIIAPHGAALTNLVFAQPGTKVIEFQPWKLQDTFFRLSRSVGLDYYYLKSSTGPVNPMNNHQPLTIDLRTLQETLLLASID